MKIHPDIPAELHDEITKAAMNSKLDSIENWDKTYHITKVSGNNNRTIALGPVGRGSLFLIGSGEWVALYLVSTDDWFRSSAVVSCTKNGDGYDIETENSVYKLD
jgi:hypothetical protein